MRICGKHAIQAACFNVKRGPKIFYGSKKTYDNLQLNCRFINYKEEFLETSEVYVPCLLDEILERDRIIMLDALEDPHNLGSVIRSAAILGYCVLIRKNKGCSINQTVLKCASGGVDNTLVCEIQNLRETLKKIKDRGFWIYGLDENGSLKAKTNPKVLLVVGSEGSGLKNLTKKNCDYLFRLQGNRNFCVYNASVAAAIAMYDFKCQTGDSNP